MPSALQGELGHGGQTRATPLAPGSPLEPTYDEERIRLRPKRCYSAKTSRPPGQHSYSALRGLDLLVRPNEDFATFGVSKITRSRLRRGAVVLAAGFGWCLFTVACGGGGTARSSDDIARGIEQAIQATRASDQYAPEARSATKQAVCDALNAYSSEAAGTLADLFQDYAEQQQINAQLGLTDVDPSVADRLVDAAKAIDATQEASDVVEEMDC